MRYLIYFIAIGLSAGLFQQPVGAAYKEINVVGGGTISGKVTIEGGKPRPMAFNLVTIPDPVFCGTISTGTGWRIVEDFISLSDLAPTFLEAAGLKPTAGACVSGIGSCCCCDA